MCQVRRINNYSLPSNAHQQIIAICLHLTVKITKNGFGLFPVNSTLSQTMMRQEMVLDSTGFDLINYLQLFSPTHQLLTQFSLFATDTQGGKKIDKLFLTSTSKIFWNRKYKCALIFLPPSPLKVWTCFHG